MIVFVGSKRAFISFQQQYSLTEKVRHVTRIDQLSEFQNSTVVYDKAEKNNPMWASVIAAALTGVTQKERILPWGDGQRFYARPPDPPPRGLLEQATGIARRMVREWGMSEAVGARGAYRYPDPDSPRSPLRSAVRPLPEIPICMWCGNGFQTPSDRDAHEEVCGG